MDFLTYNNNKWTTHDSQESKLWVQISLDTKYVEMERITVLVVMRNRITEYWIEFEKLLNIPMHLEPQTRYSNWSITYECSTWIQYKNVILYQVLWSFSSLSLLNFNFFSLCLRMRLTHRFFLSLTILIAKFIVSVT